MISVRCKLQRINAVVTLLVAIVFLMIQGLRAEEPGNTVTDGASSGEGARAVAEPFALTVNTTPSALVLKVTNSASATSGKPNIDRPKRRIVGPISGWSPLEPAEMAGDSGEPRNLIVVTGVTSRLLLSTRAGLTLDEQVSKSAREKNEDDEFFFSVDYRRAIAALDRRSRRWADYLDDEAKRHVVALRKFNCRFPIASLVDDKFTADQLMIVDPKFVQITPRQAVEQLEKLLAENDRGGIFLIGHNDGKNYFVGSGANKVTIPIEAIEALENRHNCAILPASCDSKSFHDLGFSGRKTSIEFAKLIARVRAATTEAELRAVLNYDSKSFEYFLRRAPKAEEIEVKSTLRSGALKGTAGFTRRLPWLGPLYEVSRTGWKWYEALTWEETSAAPPVSH